MVYSEAVAGRCPANAAPPPWRSPLAQRRFASARMPGCKGVNGSAGFVGDMTTIGCDIGNLTGCDMGTAGADHRCCWNARLRILGKPEPDRRFWLPLACLPRRRWGQGSQRDQGPPDRRDSGALAMARSPRPRSTWAGTCRPKGPGGFGEGTDADAPPTPRNQCFWQAFDGDRRDFRPIVRRQTVRSNANGEVAICQSSSITRSFGQGTAKPQRPFSPASWACRPPRTWGPFHVVATSNGVNLDFMERQGEILSRHFAFLVSETEFDEIFERTGDQGRHLLGRPGADKAG